MCLFHVFAQPQIGTAPGRYKDCARAEQNAPGCRRVPHPPVFCQKRRQTIENKGLERGKERQEIPRGGKWMKGQGLSSGPTTDAGYHRIHCGQEGRSNAVSLLRIRSRAHEPM
jgi:hypothetical protein